MNTKVAPEIGTYSEFLPALGALIRSGPFVAKELMLTQLRRWNCGLTKLTEAFLGAVFLVSIQVTLPDESE
jgi:hypothetical protein